MADQKSNRQMPAPKIGQAIPGPVVAPPVVSTPVVHTPEIPLVPPLHSDAEAPHVDLAIPEEHKVKREFGSGSNVEVHVPQSHAVEVIATRPGFIYNTRKVAGDRFAVSDMSQVGEWMILADPQLEAQRQAVIALEKAKARQL